jgi:Uma2 family endonuclease
MKSMDGLVKQGATYDDLVDLPDNVTGEIIAGDLYATPRPPLGHGLLHTRLCGRIEGRFGEGGGNPGGWWIVTEPELHLGPDVLVPDLAGWRLQRMPAYPSRAAHVTLAPDWVCEILSPSTARLNRAAKLPAYAREGVRHAWLVDPAARTLEIFRLEDGRWVLTAVRSDTDLVRPEPFEAAEFDLASWWPPAD